MWDAAGTDLCEHEKFESIKGHLKVIARSKKIYFYTSQAILSTPDRRNVCERMCGSFPIACEVFFSSFQDHSNTHGVITPLIWGDNRLTPSQPLPALSQWQQTR